MAIDYQSDVVEALFASNVLDETAYQIPGDFDLPSGFGEIGLSGGAINVAGTVYSVNDVLTLSGGTSTTTAQIKVTEVSTGAVTAYTVQRAGVYTVRPANPVSVTGGGGSGFKLSATWSGLSEQRLLTMIEIMRATSKIWTTLMKRNCYVRSWPKCFRRCDLVHRLFGMAQNLD